jgi:flagellar biosynthesis/type III secretory pathway protein FliH
MNETRSNVIKSDLADQIRPLFAQGDLVKSNAEQDAIKRTQLDILAEQIAMHQAEIAKHDLVLKEVYQKGYSAGQEAAETEFEDSRANALEKLTRGIEIANADFRKSLKYFQDYAGELAASAMAALIGEHEMYHKMLVALISKNVDALSKTGIVSVVVSRSDFPDSRELSEVQASVSDIETRISVVDDLPAGRCDINLRLGTAEIDFKQSWAEISKILLSNADASDDTTS